MLRIRLLSCAGIFSLSLYMLYSRFAVTLFGLAYAMCNCASWKRHCTVDELSAKIFHCISIRYLQNQIQNGKLEWKQPQLQ